MYGNTGAKAAIEMALHDLLGRATGRPLLCAARRARSAAACRSSPCIGTGELATPTCARRAKKRATGYIAFKIKVGVDEPLMPTPNARARICDALGARLSDFRRCQPGLQRRRSGAHMCARSPTAGSISSSSRSARTISRAWRQVAAREPRRDRRRRRHPFARRHRAPSRAQGRARREPQGDQARRPARPCATPAALCERIGMNVNISCKTGESSIASAAAVHIAAVVPAIAWGLTADQSTALPTTSPAIR